MAKNISIISFIILLLITLPVFSVNSADVSVKYAEVTISRSPIRKEVSPKSEVLEIASEGKTFEVVSVGNLWVKVKTENGEGWLPTTACRITDRNKTALLSTPGHTIAFVGLIFLGLAFVLFLALRGKEEKELVL